MAAEEDSPGPVDDAEELPPKPTEFHRFLDLPKEVRESIWDHAIRDKVYPVGAYPRYFTDTVELRAYNTTDSKVFPFLPANADLELSVRCTGLQYIKFRMHNRRLQYHVDPYDADEETLPVPVEDLWDHYMMHRLVACEKVVKVIILLKGRCSDASEGSASMLVAKIKDEFLITGRSVAAEDTFG